MIYKKLLSEFALRNLSIEDVSKKINVSKQGLYMMFRTKSMKVETLEKISEVLNINVEYWFKDYDYSNLSDNSDHISENIASYSTNKTMRQSIIDLYLHLKRIESQLKKDS